MNNQRYQVYWAYVSLSPSPRIGRFLHVWDTLSESYVRCNNDVIGIKNFNLNIIERRINDKVAAGVPIYEIHQEKALVYQYCLSLNKDYNLYLDEILGYHFN